MDNKWMEARLVTSGYHKKLAVMINQQFNDIIISDHIIDSFPTVMRST